MSTLVLDATTKTITAVMSGAAATNNPEFTAAYADSTSSTLTEGANDGALNGTSSVTLVAAPASSTRRVIKWITIQNKDTAPVTITILYANSSGSTTRQIAKVTLAINDTWTTDGTFDSTGNLKTSSIGVIANALTMNNGGSGAASGSTYDGTTAKTISYNSIGAAATGAANTFTAAQTFRVANAIRSEVAATQDAVVISGRAGGTSSYAVTLTPATLSSSSTLTLPNVSDTVATVGTAQTFLAAQTFRAANAVRSEAASTQDAIVIAGRAGGTNSYAVTLTPATLSSSTTLTLPNATDTLAVLGTAQTFTAAQTFSGTSSNLGLILQDAAEVCTVSATAATGTINYDVTTQNVLYYTTNASANWTVNFRGSSGTSLNTLMSTGQVLTVTFLVAQGSTAYYNSAVQVDGASVTPKYQGGTAWSSGNASGVDAYVYAIVKTGSAAFTIFASQTRFA